MTSKIRERLIFKLALDIRQNARLVLGLCLPLVLSLYAGWTSFWTDSETWNAVVVKYLFANDPSYDFKIKPLFNFLLYLNFHIARLLQVHPMDTGRAFFAVNGALAVYLLFHLSRRLSGSNGLGYLTALLWVCDSFFIKRMAHVRSDNLITTIVLGLTLLQAGDRWKTWRPSRRISIFSIAAVTALLITPKAIIVMSFWAAVFLRSDLFTLFKGRRKLATALGLGILVVTAAAVAGFPFFRNSFRFFVGSFSDLGMELPYWDLRRLEHVYRFAIENLIFILLWIFNLYFGLFKRAGLNETAKLHFDFANLCLGLLVVYPDRLPFFIVGLSPYWLIPLAASWNEIRFRIKPAEQKRLATMIAGFSLISCVYWSSFAILRHNTNEQKTFIQWIQSKWSQLEPLGVYDAVGAFPFQGLYRTAVYHWFVGPAEAGNSNVLLAIDGKVNVILYAAKLTSLGQPFFAYLNQNFWHDGGGLYIRKFNFKTTKNKVQVEELKAFLLKKMPYLEWHPDHQIYIELHTSDGINLSRYAKWDGADTPFSNSISLNELTRYGNLMLPPTVTDLTILPVRLTTPFESSWPENFRFDPEF